MSWLILTHWPHGIETWRHPQNRKCITYRNAVRGPSHGHGQRAQKSGKVQPCDFRVMRADRRTNKDTETDVLITILGTPPGRGACAKEPVEFGRQCSGFVCLSGTRTARSCHQTTIGCRYCHRTATNTRWLSARRRWRMPASTSWRPPTTPRDSPAPPAYSY